MTFFQQATAAYLSKFQRNYCIGGSHNVLLKSIQQLQRNSNLALDAYDITNQGPKLCIEESD
jgi:hypothetical protein